jgi:hypothetical protein
MSWFNHRVPAPKNPPVPNEPKQPILPKTQQ